MAIWSGGRLLEISETELAGRIFWAKFQYAGIVAVPIGWLRPVFAALELPVPPVLPPKPPPPNGNCACATEVKPATSASVRRETNFIMMRCEKCAWSK